MIKRGKTWILAVALVAAVGTTPAAAQITRGGEPAQLDVRQAGEHSVRVTLKPVSFTEDFPFTPTLSAERTYPAPVISLRSVDAPVERQVGSLTVVVRGNPLTVEVRNAEGRRVQQLTFADDGSVSFPVGDSPVLGMGEGGPMPERDWRTNHEIEFDRRGRFHEMRPRWQSNAYGSRSPVALLGGTEGWGLYVATPWVQVDLQNPTTGKFVPWKRPDPPRENASRDEERAYIRETQGRPPASQPVNVFDAFIFDASDPAAFMKDVSDIAGATVMPPKWALGYMQSHRELVDAELDSEALLLDVDDTFRRKQIPLDAVIYLGTGFTPTGWNTRQPSFDFNPEVFKRPGAEVISDIHARNTKVIVHIVPWDRDRLETLHGTIPPKPGEVQDASHINTYWQEHVGLVRAGVDAWWP